MVMGASLLMEDLFRNDTRKNPHDRHCNTSKDYLIKRNGELMTHRCGNRSKLANARLASQRHTCMKLRICIDRH